MWGSEESKSVKMSGLHAALLIEQKHLLVCLIWPVLMQTLEIKL